MIEKEGPQHANATALMLQQSPETADSITEVLQQTTKTRFAVTTADYIMKRKQEGEGVASAEGSKPCIPQT